MRDRQSAFELVALQAAGSYRLAGIFGFETATAALARGNAEFAQHAHVELDLGGVTGADSAGLAVLLAWTERTLRRGGTIRFVNLPRQIAAIATIADAAVLLRRAEPPAGEVRVSAA